MPEKKKTDNEKLNPQIANATIGVRNLRTITIYPLSMADQLRTTDLISQALQQFVLKGDLQDIAFVSFVVELIKENLAKILEMTTDEEGDKLLQDMTNVQAMELAEMIWDMNYGSIAKNVKGLAEKVKSLFPSARQLPQSLNTTDSTDSKISSESPSEKVA